MVLPRQIHWCFEFGNQIIRNLLLVLILVVIDTAEAQTRTNSTRPNPTTDPSEVASKKEEESRSMVPRQSHWCFPFRKPMRSLVLILCTVVAVGLLIDNSEAQGITTNTTRIIPTTDPIEAIALNIMFSRWNISATHRWNISGEICSGVALDDTAINELNPGIKCDCSYAANTTCHITNLWVHQLNVWGPLPQELWNLTYLIDLNLGKNYLTGPIPASIRNLNRMQYLSFGLNALSGEIPPEIGQLTELRSLGLDVNNFSGSLPPEMGNITRLTQLYLDSCGLIGEIPSSYARLRNLETVWACNNEFTGRIPDFIGNWSGLNSLKLEGNSFQGPIPSSFLGLASLNELLISDLVNGSSSLDFLRNMNSLSTLNLRNNNISGEIPSFLSEFQSLRYLDLSFNSLSGTIPDFLLNLDSLANLFLGNNMLTGALPTQKSQLLLNIDLSYNELSGSFPFWITEQNLNINLVANNFVMNRSISRVLPYGLDCLQRSFPCGRGSPIYYSFAIKCGGPQIMTHDQVMYDNDMENETLGPANYHMTSTRRWAVSNVGLPPIGNNPRYRILSSRRFANTSDFELFQTARVATGSLRYYGLGLENGNYTVRLQFAETEFVGIGWESLGERVFDIYIQGILHARDFSIQREAGGTIRVVVREYTALVTDNYLEIHFFWAGKGTYNIPYDGIYGPLISAISATPDFIPTVPNVLLPNVNRSHNGLIAGIVVPVGAATLIFLALLYYVHHKRKRQKELEDHELLGIGACARPCTYTYADLKVATENFSPSNKLGEGGFGPVYKGTLGDGRKIAVKQLSVASDHGKSQFIAEIATISAVQHRNLVKLYGCCIEGVRRLLVYEFLENKSLDQLLFGIGSSRLYLDWPTRYDILLGVARGLAYLHEKSQPRIVHRDVKASNILLDCNFAPKISDFGLAKLFDDNQTHISTKIAGTRGYLAPEYAMHGHLTEKADIFSFGVVVLETVSGRPNSDLSFDDDKIYLLERAWNLHGNKRQIELVDPSLQEFDEAIVEKVITVGLLCTQASPSSRPSMSRVVAMLTGDIEVLSVTLKPNYLTEWNSNDVEMYRSTEIFSSTSNADCSQLSSGR